MIDDKIKRTTVVTEAMHKIKEMISSDKYKVGDKLPTEAELAERFGTGRSSIREAIKVFQYLGILETRVPKGTFICPSSNIAAEFFTWFALLEQKYINEILEMRELFEQKGIYNLIQEFAVSHEKAERVLAELEEQIANMETAISEKDSAALAAVDFEFHRILVAEAENTLFLSIYDLLKSFTIDEMSRTHKAYEDLHKLIDEHRVIINAIKTENDREAIKFHASHFPLIRKNLQKNI